MREFNVPEFYKSPIISKLKEIRKTLDPKKKDFTPTKLDFGPVRFLIARHFGFCFGVENAIERAYRALDENPGKKIYFLSEMIHNPLVNSDLQSRGIQFILDTQGNQLIGWDSITSDDLVIIPAFGTTLETKKLLANKGVHTDEYNTTCPFVERVWKMSKKLGDKDYTIVIHGKSNHEETKATFSHAEKEGPSLIIKNIEETKLLEKYIRGEKEKEQFYLDFQGKYSKGFDPSVHLKKIGVVNQTTMLASETKEIANYVKNVIEELYGSDDKPFADTRDSLCYATNDNQSATYGLLDKGADLAIVVGGYNSSNTTHLVELCEEKYPTYFITGNDKLLNKLEIQHFDWKNKVEGLSKGYLPEKDKIEIILTSGASCPDSTVEEVLRTVLGYYENTRSVEEVLSEVEKLYAE
ncbi:MAG: 4-hydroxy-3-methylbut-2-enyl diphosphate reductase [Flavobacteriales bacterium]|jgi:4-hydroxy-3-methylbut-2-enyl diphosphate reductase|tara:strand:+ start:1667 stop:2896 length:1230 start_codon:yes stop_codon:yes gene_type:complete